MITFTKKVNELQCFKEVDGSQNIVHTIIWTLIATNDVDGFESYGMRTQVPKLPNTEFVSFDTLTEDIVLSWIDLYTSPLQMDSAMKYLENIFKQKEEQISRLPPWQKNEELVIIT